MFWNLLLLKETLVAAASKQVSGQSDVFSPFKASDQSEASAVAARVRTVRTCRDDGCWDAVYCRFPIASKCLEVLVESRKHQCEQLLLCVSLLCWIVVEFMFKHRNVKEKKLQKYKSGWESVRSCRGRLVIPAVHLSTVSARRQDAKLYPATEITQFVGLTNLIQTRKVWKVLEEYRLVWDLCKPTIQSPRCSWNYVQKRTSLNTVFRILSGVSRWRHVTVVTF